MKSVIGKDKNTGRVCGVEGNESEWVCEMWKGLCFLGCLASSSGFELRLKVLNLLFERRCIAGFSRGDAESDRSQHDVRQFSHSTPQEPARARTTHSDSRRVRSDVSCCVLLFSSASLACSSWVFSSCSRVSDSILEVCAACNRTNSD